MKHRYLLLLLLAGALFLRCATGRKVTCNIPPNYPDVRRKELLEVFGKGMKLYKANCSECHGVFTSGKDKVPNFSNTQIDNYSTRFLARDPKNHAVLTQMSPEQLNEVLLFLRYKRIDSTTTTRRRG